MTSPFLNEPVADFDRDPQARASLQAALAAFKPVDAPLVVGGKRVRTRERIDSTNPCSPRELVGRAGKATPALAERAVKAAAAAFPSWSRKGAEHRAAVLFKAALLMRERRWELDATLVLEVSKSWTEADADVAEAIDFCEYYAREALRLAEGGPVTPVAGERNRLDYVPAGPGLVVSPWNFPCAILTGMAAAAIVAGNPVVLKPASATPIIAWKVLEIFEQAGLPPGVLNYLPGPGGEVGDLLVDHPALRFVSFTGSREVGTRIYERAGRTPPGQPWLKRAVIEMGGKDAILVDEDADLDAAAAGIVASAFGFQGQKCSACSRAILVDKVHDEVLDRVLVRTKALRVGDVRDPATQMGAVVDERAMKKIQSAIAAGKRRGRLRLGGKRLARDGWFLEPTVFDRVDATSALAQEEIFGPVLAVIRAKGFADALRIANDTAYGLTGAYYGRANLDAAAREFHVGNLYLNRKCTGALVGGHPFGGFKMSGTNAKAGGPDYLRLFMEAKLVSEKV
jgi:1-pyrroline-5-carboxylate dehydrogenase